jgi:poly(3-hydroxybutyrate) depolymerase
MGLRSRALMKLVRVAAPALYFQLALTHAPAALAQEPAAQPALPAAGRGRGPIPVDPRVQMRDYLFTETNEKISYALFVSSKVRPGKKNPLVIALHGLCGGPASLLRGNALDLAQEGGYILVGPMGYNPRGWYGVPNTSGGGRGRGRPCPPSGAFSGAEDAPNLRELSERDVLNVLELVRKEFNVDERRTYLMGHSMGGAGTFHLAVKYPGNWAATASIAPAAFGMQPASLSAIPNLPMMIVHGDADTAVPVEVGRSWAEAMKELMMTHQYIEVPGGDHGNVISIGMPDIFTFFDTHSKPGTR